jgi:hypothetical protein
MRQVAAHFAAQIEQMRMRKGATGWTVAVLFALGLLLILLLTFV